MTITTDIEQARREANTADKAANFWTRGYSYKGIGDGLFFVYPPEVEKPAYIVDVVNPHCTCQGFGEYGNCSHLIAMTEEAAFLAHVAELEAANEPPVDALS